MSHVAARAKRRKPVHIHLPSVHIRTDEGGATGFDYEQNLFVAAGAVQRVELLIVIEEGQPALVRETRDQLCAEEWALLQENLPALMEEGNPDAQEAMEEIARREFARQKRIAAGQEHACAVCGCSESRACSGGCMWASKTICSRCI